MVIPGGDGDGGGWVCVERHRSCGNEMREERSETPLLFEPHDDENKNSKQQENPSRPSKSVILRQEYRNVEQARLRTMNQQHKRQPEIKLPPTSRWSQRPYSQCFIRDTLVLLCVCTWLALVISSTEVILGSSARLATVFVGLTCGVEEWIPEAVPLPTTRTEDATEEDAAS